MAETPLTPEARQENAATLAAILGLGIESAAETLDLAITVTADPECPVAQNVAQEVIELLSRTVKHVSTSVPDTDSAAELVIGPVPPRTSGTKIYVSVTVDQVVISTIPQAPAYCEAIPPILALLAACYASAATLYHAIGGILPFELRDPLIFRFSELGVNTQSLARPIDIGHTYLAGAGAIGNGFIWAARHLNFSGRLEIVDDDTVSSGNLNRQIWFGRDDIGKAKVDQLKAKAQSSFPSLEIVPRRCRLQNLPEKSDGPWLRRLIVAVDSRRARRELQNEFPGEVFDASTTDIREIVLHYHRQPTTHACLSCIYDPDDEEFTREQHIAEHLGVTINEVRSERISCAAALAIVNRFPNALASEIEGMAYDSFFKRLCAEGQLGVIADKRTVAPFAFVSVLAGTLLALEVVRRLGDETNIRDFNYWRLSPWFSPLGRRRVMRPKQPGCTFCGQLILNTVNTALWNPTVEASIPACERS
jgi:hypothetical protein